MKTIGIDISVLNDSHLTGIGVYVYELVSHFLEINRTDNIILFGVTTIRDQSYIESLEFRKYPNVTVKSVKIPARLSRLSFMAWQQFDWPPIELFTGPVDIFHTFNWFFLPQSKGKKIATFFDMTSIMFPQWHLPRTTQLDQLRFDRIASKADMVLTISENSKTDFLNYYPGKDVEIIYPSANEIYNSNINSGLTKSVLSKYKIKPGYILSVSTIEPRKNIDLLVNAYLESRIKDPLIVVGKVGWKSEQTIDLIDKHSLKIKRLGYVGIEELKVLYQQASLFVYPSNYEGFGIPVLEAMKCGVPVICSEASSLPEVGGKAVIYANSNSQEDLIIKMVKVYNNRGLAQELRKKGLEQAKKFTWRKSAHNLNSLYQNL